MIGKRGKLFWRKVFPGPLSKDLWARVRVDVDPGFYRCGSAVEGLVRSPIGDPDLRSPSGFDFGLRPPLRMTRKTEMVAQSLDLRRICWIFGVVFKVRIYAGIPA